MPFRYLDPGLIQTLFFSLIFCMLQEVALAQGLTATRVIQRTENLLRGDNSYSRSRITIQKKRITRKMTFDNWDDRKNKESFIRILSPKKDRGISFLKLQKNLWQYIPKIGREIKIEDSLMQDSWMGSDFSNDDLVRESSIVDDYRHKFSKRSGLGVHVIVLTAKEGSPVVWDKIIAHIDRKTFFPKQYEFYDHKNRLKRRLTFSEVKSFHGKRYPSKQVMSSIKNNRVISSTIIETLKLKFNTKISRRVFSKSNLRK